jgi:hypothetical protein
MRSFFVAYVSLLLACSACSGNSGGSIASTSSTSPAADVTGEWAGRATALGDTISVSADLVQTGSSISGSMRSPGGCIGGGKVSGSISGDSVSATVTAGDVVATFDLTLSNDDQLDGTFDLPPSGVCAAQRGSLSLTRK